MTADGKPHLIADVYGASSNARAAPLGDWTLYEVDSFEDTSRMLLHFLADGHLDATALDSKKVYDDVHGDRLVPNVTVIAAGHRSGIRSCAIANRWRVVDDLRLGILFTCDDGLGREAVFSLPGPVASLPLPSTPNSDMGYELTLETVGGESVTTRSAAGLWPLYQFYRFRLVGATD